MILRLFQGTVRAGAGTELLHRLRTDTIPSVRQIRAIRSLTYGFRHDAGALHHLVISTWDDVSAILERAGSLDRAVVTTQLDDVLDDVRIDHFELIDGVDEGVVTLDGPVIGVVRAEIAENHESSAIEMIRAVRPQLVPAGVIALHVGRRIQARTTELIVLAIWRDRASLHRFARSRARGLIDPAFLAHTTRWSFETFDCLAPERLLVPPAGPAVLLLDDEGRLIDASTGVESVVGVPGELVLQRSLADLVDPSRADDARAMWRDLLRHRHWAGTLALVLPDGRGATVTLRAEADVPEVGLHAIVATVGPSADDGRPVDDLVAEAFAARADVVEAALDPSVGLATS